MKRLIPLAGALALATMVPEGATAQDGNGKGRDRAERGADRDRGPQGRPDRGNRDGDDRGERGPRRAERGDDDRRGGPPQARELVRQVERREDRARREWRGDDRDDGRDDRVYARLERDPQEQGRNRDRYVFDRDWDRALITGCPPGLAKKDNGCLPPGQARRIAQARYNRYDSFWDRSDDYRYRYDDGYLYRYNSGGNLLGYLPALGGALFTGNVWPQQYAYEPAPAYYTDYYRLNDGYDYRYADGVLYQTDRGDNSISQIAALLTGQEWGVGQRMPSGYDVYNVPYGYRDRYADSADSWYRYNDGYVYQVDPTTQLVQAVIQLIT